MNRDNRPSTCIPKDASRCESDNWCMPPTLPNANIKTDRPPSAENHLPDFADGIGHLTTPGGVHVG